MMHEKGRTQFGTQHIQTCEEEYTFFIETENDCRKVSLEPMLLIHCAFVLENSCRQEQGGDSTIQLAVVRPRRAVRTAAVTRGWKGWFVAAHLASESHLLFSSMFSASH